MTVHCIGLVIIESDRLSSVSAINIAPMLNIPKRFHIYKKSSAVSSNDFSAHNKRAPNCVSTPGVFIRDNTVVLVKCHENWLIIDMHYKLLWLKL